MRGGGEIEKERKRERETWVRLKALVAGKRDQKVFIRPPFHNLFLCTSDGDTLWRLAASTKRILFLFAAVPATNPTNEPGQIMFVSLSLSLSLFLSFYGPVVPVVPFLITNSEEIIVESGRGSRIEKINNKRKLVSWMLLNRVKRGNGGNWNGMIMIADLREGEDDGSRLKGK